MRVRLQSYLRKSRHEIYYFRRAIPAAIVDRFATKELYVSLKTGDRRQAEKRALPIYVETERIFQAAKHMARKKDEGVTSAGMMSFFEVKDGKVTKVGFDHTPEEADAVAELLPKLMKGIAQGGAAPSEAIEPSLRLGDLFERYCRAQKTWRPGTLKSIKGDLLQIAQVAADPLVSELSKSRLAELQATLQALPPNINKNPRFKGKSVSEIVAMGLPAQSSSSVKKKWGYLSAALDWGLSRDFVKSNDAKGMKLKAKATSYEKFSDDDLVRLFASDSYRAGFDEAFKYWTPLIGLFTGARLDEICQLRRSDVKEIDSVLCFHFTEQENDPSKVNAKEKSLKAHEASARTVPVHSTLLKLGFQEYLGEIDRDGCGRLFPELRDAIKARISARASEWFTRYRRSVGVGAREGKSRKAFHSFRHTAISRLQAAGVPLEVREFLVGHTPTAKMNIGVYGGEYRVTMLKLDVEKLEYSVAFLPFVPNDEQRKARRSAIAGPRNTW